MKIKCELCPNQCALDEGQAGICKARANQGGEIKSLSYGLVTSVALDPVEKKPFSRWQSGKAIFSVGSFGCNLHCPFCQNHSISQSGGELPAHHIPPEELVNIALEQRQHGNIGLAFTYNEPFLSYEYILDAAKIAKEKGLLVALVTNGYINPGPLEKLLPLIDAMNIDLKSWNENFYNWLGGELETVKKTIETAAKACHVEITTLIIPGKNDGEDDMEAEAKWLAAISDDLPLHLSRYFPRYKTLDIPATPVIKIHKLAEVAKKYLNNDYIGNI